MLRCGSLQSYAESTEGAHPKTVVVVVAVAFAVVIVVVVAVVAVGRCCCRCCGCGCHRICFFQGIVDDYCWWCAINRQ